MAERTSNLMKPGRPQVNGNSKESRIMPLAVAGVFCFVLAVMMGSTAWYLFWVSKKPSATASAVAAPSPEIAVLESPAAEESNAEPPSAAPAFVPPEGTVEVPAGEAVLAGDAKRPLQRILVDRFAISETEVTNGEYSEFIREIGHASPSGWNKHEFPAGTADHPVVNVSWKDADEFCKWKSAKLGLPVRLPTEAEWELAARSADNLKYPWGNEWNNDAAASKETGGKISAVKSFPLNRSSYGAYDMIGNVWEWIADDVGADDAVTDSQVETARKQGRRLRIVKGGSAEESSSDMNAQSRYEVPEGTRVKAIGFRYVVAQKGQE